MRPKLLKDKFNRSYIIWVSGDGSGRARRINVGKKYIALLSTLIFLCVLSVPVLEMRIIEVHKQIDNLKKDKTDLQEKVQSLQYIKKNLTKIEAKERALKEYFGMQGYESLDMFTGTGGTLDMVDYTIEPYPRTRDSKTYLPIKLKNLNSNLSILKQLLVKQENILKHTPNMMPVEKENAKISSGFGWRTNPFTNRREFHAGIDISGKTGTKIIAPANGIVLRTGYDQRLGKYIVLQHTEEIKTIYGHLSRIFLEEGEMIERGNILGAMGNSGLSTSSHLHYALIKNDRCINPMEYILDRR
jgi:murein DD-endopeptidase MepM/ murein hydrolase activator NlpD